MDILAAIDEATGCQQCGGPLGDSPSDDFCRPDHQAAWMAARADSLIGYREPYRDHDPLPGIGTTAFRPAHPDRPGIDEFALPPITGNLLQDLTVAHLASERAVTDEQRAMVVARVAELNERTTTVIAEFVDAVRPAFETAAAQLRKLGEQMQAWLAPIAKQAQRDGLIPDVPPADPVARALHVRQHRNTGPQRRGRAPRSIGRAHTSRR